MNIFLYLYIELFIQDESCQWDSKQGCLLFEQYQFVDPEFFLMFLSEIKIQVLCTSLICIQLVCKIKQILSWKLWEKLSGQMEYHKHVCNIMPKITKFKKSKFVSLKLSKIKIQAVYANLLVYCLKCITDLQNKKQKSWTMYVELYGQLFLPFQKRNFLQKTLLKS